MENIMKHTMSRTLLALCLLAVVTVVGCRDRAERPSDATGTAGTTVVPGTTAVRVSDVALGRGVAADKSITGATDTFSPNDTIYATVTTDGTGDNVMMRARWTYQDGQVVEDTSQMISPRGMTRTEFHIAKPDGWPAGRYRVEVMMNGQPAMAKDFTVR
jgi:hypothetical protein